MGVRGLRLALGIPHMVPDETLLRPYTVAQPDTLLESKQGKSDESTQILLKLGTSPDVSSRSKFGTIMVSGDRDRKDALASKPSPAVSGAKTL